MKTKKKTAYNSGPAPVSLTVEAMPEEGAKILAAHTPGPWTYSPAADAIWTNPPDAPQICALPAFRPDNPANGRLIAAAPELLAALKRLLGAIEADKDFAPQMSVNTSWETNGQAIDAARNAIARAEGGAP